MNALSDEIARLHNDDCFELLSAALKVESDERAEGDREYAIRRLRTRALDFRAAYARHMDAYGDTMGKAQARWNRGEVELFKSFAREAASCLACATDCMIQAEAAEREADEIASNGFVTILDGVSARLSPMALGGR
jgi:hypothetical protein